MVPLAIAPGVCRSCRTPGPVGPGGQCAECLTIDAHAPRTLRVGEQAADIDWAARHARARRWRVAGALLSVTPYPTDHEPCDDDRPDPKPRKRNATHFQ